MMAARLNHVDYTIAWIAVLPIEAEAALGMLDKQHLGHFESMRGDDYIYIGGEINGHNVVVATWPAGQSYGVGAAAALVNQVKTRFTNIWFALLVGVAAGLPNLTPNDRSLHRDVRLGDVLVCVPEKANSGVVHYDLGKDTDAGFLTNGRQVETPAIVRAAIGNIQLTKKKPYKKGHEFAKYLDAFLQADEDGKFQRPSEDTDQLFKTSDDLTASPTLISREYRDETEQTRVWYGSIGSGNSMMRNARRRDELRDKYNLIGLEMEAAGVVNTLPTGVVRGVCDYGDGHKNKDWQPYAAAVAAVYAKGILLTISPKVGQPQQGPLIPPDFTHSIGARVANPLFTGQKSDSSSMINRIPSDLEPIDERLVSAAEAGFNLLSSKSSVDTLGDYRSSCLASLDFQEMGMREYRVSRPELATCQWIYTDYSYVQWAENVNMLLWIKGKPGSGKSVLMKDLHAQRDRDRDEGSIIMLKFFFNARGTPKEKTILGLYLALLHDLLAQDPVSMTNFLPIYMRKAQLRKQSAGLVQRDETVMAELRQFKGQKTEQTPLFIGIEQDFWDAAELAELFHTAIERKSSKLIEIFVDALDECNEQEIREFIGRCEQSIERACSTGSRLRICWSSRYYPHISLRGKRGIELSLDHHNGMDIETYVEKELAHFPQTLISPLKDNLLRRANGVFLWIVLVVRQLRKFLDQGKREPQLLALLSTMPSELEDLFDQILRTKSRSPEDQHDFIGLLQWTFCSLGEDVPLLGNLQQSFEVYLSMVTQFEPTEPGSISCVSRISSRANYVREVNRIIDISCGLIDVRDATARASQHKGPERSSFSLIPSTQDMQNDGHPLRTTGDAQKSRKESPEGATRDHSIKSGKQLDLEQETPPIVKSKLEATAGNTAKIQVIHESVRDFFLSSKRSLPFLQASSANVFLTIGHRDLAAACFQALLEFDLEDNPVSEKLETFADEAMLVWRHRDEFSRRFKKNIFLVYAQRHGLTHFSYAFEYFNNEKPSSLSVMESTSVRRIVLRNYLRLICLFELEEETMLYKAFESNHGHILIQHHQMFGLSVSRLEDLWPAFSDQGQDGLETSFSYPCPWNIPGGMKAPKPNKRKWETVLENKDLLFRTRKSPYIPAPTRAGATSPSARAEWSSTIGTWFAS